MKTNVRKIVSLFLVCIMIFNSGANIVIANDGMGDYGTIVVLEEQENDNTVIVTEKANLEGTKESEEKQDTEGQDGEAGSKEVEGDQGAEEQDGEAGSKEVEGDQGAEDQDEEAGVKEVEGDQGAEEQDGEAGSKEVEGDQGAEEQDGEAGSKEVEGEQDTEGQDGEAGSKEVEGDQDAEEQDGEAGSKEVEGDQGAEEQDGEAGSKEVEGDQGAEEQDGEAGSKEVEGEQDTEGQDGEAGSKEVEGDQGAEEQDGEAGSKEVEDDQDAEGQDEEAGVKEVEGDQDAEGQDGEAGSKESEDKEAVKGTDGEEGSEEESISHKSSTYIKALLKNLTSTKIATIDDNINLAFEELMIVSFDLPSHFSLKEELNFKLDMDGKVISAYSIKSLEKVSEVTGKFKLNNDTDKKIKILYVNPVTKEIDEFDTTKGENFEYEFTITNLDAIFPTNEMPVMMKMIKGSGLSYNSISESNPLEYNFANNNVSDTSTNSDLAYFNANFFNYDARMFNFATRSEKLAQEELITATDAATLLNTVDNVTDAGNYAVSSTKGTMLFGYSGNEAHYNDYYNQWLSNFGSRTINSGFNTPTLPQNSWSNQVITQGLAGAPGSGLINVGGEWVPNFVYTEAGFFLTRDNAARTLVNGEDWLKHEVRGVKFPFLKNNEGYYEFDSKSMYIDNVLTKTPNNNKLKLYTDGNFPLVGHKDDGFWPFATGSGDLGYRYNTGDPLTYYLSDQFHFAVDLEASFVIPEGKKVNGKDMIFEFSGDDDVFVYIDNKLVLDVGGCHAVMNGRINFSDGKVTYYKLVGEDGQVSKNGTETTNNVVLDYTPVKDSQDLSDRNSILSGDELYSKAADIEIIEDPVVWDLETDVGLTNLDEGTTHTIKVFYLERGSSESNFRIRFNIPTLPEIETTKTAYVYDDGEKRSVDVELDEAAYTGQDVYFDIKLQDKFANLNDIIVYDEDLSLLIDKNGIKEEVKINNSSNMYNDINEYNKGTYYKWRDTDISDVFSELKLNDTIIINENGIKHINSKTDVVTSYGEPEDIQKLKEVLRRTTTKYITSEKVTEENTAYVLGHCYEVAFGKPFVVSSDTVKYDVIDTKLFIKQIVVDKDGKIIENAKDALVETTSSKDTRNLYFPSNANEYKKYTSYYNNVTYTVNPVVSSEYKLIKMDIRDDLDGFDPMTSSYNNKKTFNYTVNDKKEPQYEKYVTIYLQYEPNNNWHGDDAILNEFDTITITL